MSATTTVRISRESHDLVQELAAREGTSLQDVLSRALETYRRDRFLDSVNEGYRALREDPKAWNAVREETAAWDATLEDGFDRHPPARRRKR